MGHKEPRGDAVERFHQGYRDEDEEAERWAFFNRPNFSHMLLFVPPVSVLTGEHPAESGDDCLCWPHSSYYSSEYLHAALCQRWPPSSLLVQNKCSVDDGRLLQDLIITASLLLKCSSFSLTSFCFFHAASRPHHPECRPGDCDEAGHHPGVRQARGPAGEGGQRLHLLRASRQVAQRRERQREREDIQSAIVPMEYIPFIF